MSDSELDDLILLQRQMTAEIQVGNEPDHASLKHGNHLAQKADWQPRPTNMTNFDEFSLNLWCMAEVLRPKGGMMSVHAYERMWKRLLYEQQDDLKEMLAIYPGAKMGQNGKKDPR